MPAFNELPYYPTEMQPLIELSIPALIADAAASTPGGGSTLRLRVICPNM